MNTVHINYYKTPLISEDCAETCGKITMKEHVSSKQRKHAAGNKRGKMLPSAVKHVSVAERGKIFRRCQTRENKQPI